MGNQYVATKANPMAAFRYNVAFASNLFTEAGFSRISGLSVSAETIPYREGGESTTPRKFPGMVSYPAIRMERGASQNMDMYAWCAQCYQISPDAQPLADDYTAAGFRQNLVINGLDSDNSSVIRSWQVLSAWPKSVDMGDFDAMSSGVLIETLTIEHEGLIPTAGGLGSGGGTNGVPNVGNSVFNIGGVTLA